MALPAWQATGTAVSTTTGTLTVAWPTHAVDDIALLFVETQGAASASLGTANGFVEVTNSPKTTGSAGTGTKLSVYWCRATSSSMASPIMAAGTDHQYGVIITYRNCKNSGNPFDTTHGGVKATASTSATISGTIATSVANALQVEVITSDVDATAAFASGQTNASLASFNERFDAGTTDGNGGGIAVWDWYKVVAGVPSNTTLTVTNSINAFMKISLVGNPVTVALNTADATNFRGDTTPQLLFTGTDTGSLDIQYSVIILSGMFIDSYPEDNANSGGLAVNSINRLGVGQSFTGNGGTLGGVAFSISKTGSPTGNAVAKIYTHSGTYGASSIPTGAALATSDNFDVSTLTTVASTRVLTFSGANQIVLTNAVNYIVSFEFSGGDNLNTPTIMRDSSAPTHSGNAALLNTSSVWSALNTQDLLFYILPVGATGTGVLYKVSGTDAGFIDITNGADTDPFASGDQIGFTVQAGDALAPGTYYWRVAGLDPSGTNTYGVPSSTRSFTIFRRIFNIT
jgi:hypothetical protein